jgi:serine/threonine-protein kinase
VASHLRRSTLIVQTSPLDDRNYREGDLVAGKYLLTYPIGEGAMGSVWRAQDIFLGVSVALKLLRPEHRALDSQREYLSERLTREATTLAGLRHPSIVRVFDFGASSWNDPYLAMELLDGELLSAVLLRSGRLVPEYAVQLLLPIAHGLAAAHDLGVVHRDLKPDNLFLSIDGRIQPKVIDFGLVKLTHGQSRKLTGAGLLGTLDYMAPEQALELPDVDHHTDQWSFCVVLYEMLGGKLPFAEPTFAETLYALVGRPAAPLTAVGIDAALWEIIERGLSKKPSQRWPSMRELGTALARWLLSRGVTVDVTGAALHTQWDLPPAHPWHPAPREVAQIAASPDEERDEGRDDERYRSEHKSGLYFRRSTRGKKPTTLPPPRRPRRRVSVLMVGLRLALAGAAVAGVTLTPPLDKIASEAKALLMGFVGASETERAQGATEAARTAATAETPAPPVPSSVP